MKRIRAVALSGLLAAGLAGSCLVLPAFAGDIVDANSLVEQLTPKKKPLTRSLTRSITAGPSAEEKADKEFLSTLPTRGLSINLRKKVSEIVEKQDLPRVDITIQFDFDSDRIRPESVADVDELGKALVASNLEKYRFLLNGHTDAKGSAEYNQDLSERRANSVRAYLIDHFKIDHNRLVAVGFGEEKLKAGIDPDSEENRRVEVVNLTSS